jgi:PAS domain S-box-containing protein
MEISQQIEAVYQRALLLRQYAVESSGSPELLDKALQELYFVLEELKTSQDELHLQNQALIATQQTVRLEQQRYQTLFELAPNGYLLTDLQGNIHQANHYAATLLLCTPQEYLINRPLLVFVYEPDRPHFQAQLANLKPNRPWEVTLKPLNGILISVMILVTKINDSVQQKTMLLWSLHDITLRQQMEHQLQAAHDQLETRVAERTAELAEANAQLQVINQELERSNHVKQRFLQMMSHELRTPLNPILGMAEALEEEILGPLNERQTKAVRLIADNGNYLLTSINNILDLVNLEASRIKLDCNVMLVKDLCTSSLAVVAPQAAAKSIQLQTNIAPEIRLIQADGERMKQILTQLLDNAIKFSKMGGTVSLAVQMQEVESSPAPDPQFIQFSIQDRGIGIAPENLNRLFQLFTQLDDRLNRDYEGIGIGLALAQCLTELHGGHITVQSQVGQGSCFTVNIPV